LVLLTPEHRQVHLADMDVAHFVEKNKKCIASDEFNPLDTLLFRKVLKTREVLEGTRNFFDSLLK
jgi:hypothetical protein